MPVTVPECSLGIRKGGGSDATWCSLVGNLTLLMLRCLEGTDETLPVRRVDRRGCDGAAILRGRLMMLQQVLVLNLDFFDGEILNETVTLVGELRHCMFILFHEYRYTGKSLQHYNFTACSR